MTLVAIGGTIGLAAALGVARLIRTLLFQVAPTDPPTFSAVPLVLAAAALVACWIPARRAARLDPNVALRHE